MRLEIGITLDQDNTLPTSHVEHVIDLFVPEEQNIPTLAEQIGDEIVANHDRDLAALPALEIPAVPVGDMAATALLILALGDKLGFTRMLTDGVDTTWEQDGDNLTKAPAVDQEALRNLVYTFVSTMIPGQEYGFTGLVPDTIMQYAYVREQRDESQRATEIISVASKPNTPPSPDPYLLALKEAAINLIK